MEQKNSNLLIALGGVLLLFGFWQFVSVFKDLKTAKEHLKNIQSQLTEEQQAKEGLQLQLDITTRELKVSHKQLKKLNLLIRGLKRDNAQLQKAKAQLEQRVAIAEAKLRSLKELKKAMQQLRQETRNQELQRYLAKKQRQKEMDAQRLATGNRGFMVKDGQSTYKPIVRIEVRPSD